MPIPSDYTERVYAGVLGKIIGVYLGRPFEGWEHDRIISELGEIYYYVNDRRDLPLKNNTLVVTDDDVSGTFTFLRALPDYGNGLVLTPAQIVIDGWAMVAPGDPELAAELARRAGSVSHDGEAIYGAQVVAAMEAQAFVESDLDRLIDVAVSLIPNDST